MLRSPRFFQTDDALPPHHNRMPPPLAMGNDPRIHRATSTIACCTDDGSHIFHIDTDDIDGMNQHGIPVAFSADSRSNAGHWSFKWVFIDDDSGTGLLRLVGHRLQVRSSTNDENFVAATFSKAIDQSL